MPEPIERKLSADERSFLEHKVASFEAGLRSSAFVLSASLLKGFTTASLITSFAYFASRDKLGLPWCLLMLGVVGAILTALWLREALRAQGSIEDSVIKYHDVILTNWVVEHQISAARYIEVTGESDEDNCFLFELSPAHSLLVFDYSTSKLFPTNRFSISGILDVKGNIVDYSLVGVEPVTEPAKKLVLKDDVFGLIKHDWNMTVLECGVDDFDSFLLRQEQARQGAVSADRTDMN